MGVLVQTYQGTLPLQLSERLLRLRKRYSRALTLAGKGDFTLADQLHALYLTLGHLLAQEAKKSPAERGMRMLEVSLSVDRLFPELRDWNEREGLAKQQQRLQASIGETA